MKPSRRFALAVAALAVAVIAIVVAALSLPSGDDEPADEAMAPTAEPVAAATPTPASPFTGFTLNVVVGVIEPVASVDDIPADRIGAYFMDTATGTVTGWYANVDGAVVHAISSDNRFVAFPYRGQRAQPGVSNPGSYALVDRASGTVYQWDGDAQPVLSQSGLNRWLASEGGRVLFRIDEPSGEDFFAVFNFDTGALETTFQAEGIWGLLSRDGTKAAIFGDALSLVDLTTRSSETLKQMPGQVDTEGQVILQHSQAGTAFLLMVDPVKQDFAIPWSLHTWEGDLVREGPGADHMYASPDGSTLAVMEPMFPSGPKEPGPWHVLSAIDTASGADYFRVVGVIPNLGYTTGNPWLSDNTGIDVSTPAFELRVAMADGSFREYSGMPSPTSPELFARGSSADTEPVVIDPSGAPSGPVSSGGPSVFDASGPTLTSVSPPGGSRSFTPPWGEVSTEMRFLVPHGGHGGIGFALTLMEPYVEQAPYGGPPPLQLQERALGIPILDMPGGELVGTVESQQLQVLEVKQVRQQPGEPMHELHCNFWRQLSNSPDLECATVLRGVWVHIEAGWVLVQVEQEGP